MQTELQKKLLARRRATDTDGAAFESVPEEKRIDARGDANAPPPALVAPAPEEAPALAATTPPSSPERRKMRRSIGGIMENSPKGQDFAELIRLRKQATEESAVTFESTPQDAEEAAKQVTEAARLARRSFGAKVAEKPAASCSPEPERQPRLSAVGRRSVGGCQDFAAIMASKRQESDAVATTFESAPVDSTTAASVPRAKTPPKVVTTVAAAAPRPARRSLGGQQAGAMDFATIMSLQRKATDDMDNNKGKSAPESDADVIAPYLPPSPVRNLRPTAVPAVVAPLEEVPEVVEPDGPASETEEAEALAAAAAEHKVADDETQAPAVVEPDVLAFEAEAEEVHEVVEPEAPASETEAEAEAPTVAEQQNTCQQAVASSSADVLPTGLVEAFAQPSQIPEPDTSLTLCGNRVAWIAECPKKSLPAYLESPLFHLPGCGQEALHMRLTFRAGVFGVDRGTECCDLSIRGGAEERSKKIMIKSFYGSAPPSKPGLSEWVGPTHDTEFCGEWPRPGKAAVRVGFIYQVVDFP